MYVSKDIGAKVYVPVRYRCLCLRLRYAAEQLHRQAAEQLYVSTGGRGAPSTGGGGAPSTGGGGAPNVPLAPASDICT